MAIVAQFSFGQPAFQKGASIDARRGMGLEIDVVAGALPVAATKEVVETDFVEGCGRGVGREVPADGWILAVCSHHHNHRIPSQDVAQMLF